jgi:hypothetical protein
VRARHAPRARSRSRRCRSSRGSGGRAAASGSPHVALYLFELGSLALTDPTGKGDFHGDFDAIRRANMEEPHRKVHTGGRAVVRAAA